MNLAETLYRFLLKAYPTRFANEYAEDMVQLFRDRLRAARSRKQYLRFWIWTMKDYVASFLAEQRRSRSSLVPIGVIVRRTAVFAPSLSIGLLFMAGFLGYRGVRNMISRSRDGENGA